ncbi:MAG: chromosomal replication initiator protein DnaA [Tepidisphaera sp.]|nr:chromosomal replication initiator protein DnaA [Tepidisphaera sp.]
MTDPDRQIWDGMLAHLRAHHATICRQWFEELEPLGIAAGTLQLRTHSPLHRDYLRRICADQFNDAAQTVSGRLLSVRFLGPDDEVLQPTPSKKPDGPRASAPSGPVQLPIDPRRDGVRPASPAGAPAQPPTSLDRPHTNGTHVPAEASPEPPEVHVRPVVANGAAVPSKPAGSTPTPYESLVVNPDYDFANFVVGPGNQLAHAAAQAVAANPGRAYNPFFVHGGVGLGKTHLLQAVCLKIVEANPRTRLYYTSCEGFSSQFFDSVQSGEMGEFRHRFRDVDVLVIDDIHFLTKLDRSQEEFFHTFNALFQAQKQIILSSDAPPEEIPLLQERLVSRFLWGLVAKVEKPDYETRIQILKTKARLRGLMLPDDAAGFIAQRLDSNIRELEGAIVKLQIQSVVEKRPMDLALARAALGEEPQPAVGEPTIQSIIDAVTEFYTIRLADLQSKHRQRSIALPRQVCMYLARRCTRHSLEEIGGFFGGRDHTTVMHAIRTVEIKREKESDFELVVRSLEEKVRAGRGPAM